MRKGTKLANFGAKLVNCGGKIQHFLEKLKKFSPLRARNYEMCTVKGMIFMEIYCTVRARFWKPNFEPNGWSFAPEVLINILKARTLVSVLIFIVSNTAVSV